MCVVFLDVESGVEIARTDLPIGQLPRTFVERSTTVELDGSTWTVESAEPALPAGIVAGDVLTLSVRRPRAVHLGDILYSLPTVCDGLPELDEPADARDDGGPVVVRHVLHEDDWRQVELVDARLHDVIDDQLARIRAIRRRHARRDGSGRLLGFEHVHVRAEPAEPLPARPAWSQASHLLPGVADGGPAGRVGFFGEPGVVPDSFAVPLGPVVLYGVVDDDAITVLGVAPGRVAGDEAPGGADGAGPDAAAVLADLLRTFDLVLVDWCRTITVPADDVPAYLEAAPEPEDELDDAAAPDAGNAPAGLAIGTWGMPSSSNGGPEGTNPNRE